MDARYVEVWRGTFWGVVARKYPYVSNVIWVPRTVEPLAEPPLELR
jgi:hypothetical protein